MTWGVTKVVASILIGLALPVLLVCFLFVGGIALLLPVALIGIAVGILKSCVYRGLKAGQEGWDEKE